MLNTCLNLKEALKASFWIPFSMFKILSSINMANRNKGATLKD